MVDTFMKILREIKEKNPDARYGQIIWNALCRAGLITAPEGNKLFYIEDKDLETVLRLLGMANAQ